jgi:hypothetical protein
MLSPAERERWKAEEQQALQGLAELQRLHLLAEVDQEVWRTRESIMRLAADDQARLLPALPELRVELLRHRRARVVARLTETRPGGQK